MKMLMYYYSSVCSLSFSKESMYGFVCVCITWPNPAHIVQHTQGYASVRLRLSSLIYVCSLYAREPKQPSTYESQVLRATDSSSIRMCWCCRHDVRMHAFVLVWLVMRMCSYFCVGQCQCFVRWLSIFLFLSLSFSCTGCSGLAYACCWLLIPWYFIPKFTRS